MAGSLSRTERARRTSVLLAALGHFAGKRSERSHLRVGATPIAAEVRGIVGRAAIDFEISGTLSVTPDNITSNSTKPGHADLVAALLANLPSDADRARLLESASATIADTGKVPAPIMAAAKAWVGGLTTRTSSTRAGSVSFVPAE